MKHKCKFEELDMFGIALDETNKIMNRLSRNAKVVFEQKQLNINQNFI